jgi:hypothetical protein
MLSKRGVQRWPLVVLVVGVVALGGCGGSAKPTVAAAAWITGFAEPCVGVQEGPVDLDVIATHGTRTVTSAWVVHHGEHAAAHEMIVADGSDRWRPHYRLRVAPGLYRVTSFDGGRNAPIAVANKLVAVGVRGGTGDLPISCK